MTNLEKIKQFGHMGSKKFSILLTALVVGFLIVLQSRAFSGLNTAISRDSSADVFREIKILKTTNDDLRDEITNLESQLDKTSTNEKALEQIKQDIATYTLLTGHSDIYGNGIDIKISGNLKAIWLTDMVNELFGAGAEAVSINGIRLTDATSGFDTVPSGQVIMNGAILKAPYEFKAIGDQMTLKEALEQPQGIIQRLKESITNVQVTLDQVSNLKIEKVI